MRKWYYYSYLIVFMRVNLKATNLTTLQYKNKSSRLCNIPYCVCLKTNPLSNHVVFVPKPLESDKTKFGKVGLSLAGKSQDIVELIGWRSYIGNLDFTWPMNSLQSTSTSSSPTHSIGALDPLQYL